MTALMFGYAISEAPLAGLVDQASVSIEARGPRLRMLALNPAKVAMAARDPGLRDILGRAEVAFADGCGICLARRLVAGRRLFRVPGIDLATALAAEAAVRGWRLYLLGARPGVAAEAADNLRQRYPDLRVVGCRHGYFDEREERTIAEEISESKADILLVALGSPAQEMWIDRHFDSLRVRVVMGVGGTFDVWASRVRRAPLLFRRLGLEWLYRIANEPHRTGLLLRTQPRFFALVFREGITFRMKWLAAVLLRGATRLRHLPELQDADAALLAGGEADCEGR